MGSQGHEQGIFDPSSHINAKSKARHPSPLKDIIKFMGYEGMVSLAGGLPHPSLFPLQQAKFDCLPAASSGEEEGDLLTLTLGRGSTPGDLDLTQFLQYGSGAGNQQLIALSKELTEKVHSPPCKYECLLHPGNTNAWSKVVGLLCEDDDFVIVEEYTYPSAQALWIPMGIKAVPIAADAEGILASNLREMLENWDESKKGARRPRTLYLVSVGSNPTGTTISKKRRQDIYDLCVEFDIVIVEDDPYYFLQYPSYHPERSEETFKPQPTAEFLKELAPSFLSIDKQGRVIRLESFSKTLFPGLRLGYFIANPVFTERLLRATEVETQDPAGLSQAFVISLLKGWGIEGYLTWLQKLQFQYQTRRNWLLEAFYAHFTVLPAEKSPLKKAQGLVACVEGHSGLKPVFSFVDPEAGMFVWSKFYFSGVKRFLEIQSENVEDPEQTFSEELWKAWAAKLVLLTPGSYYHPWQGEDKVTTKARGADPETTHFRFSFATPTKDQISTGVERMADVVKQYWA